jgi:hypothetical protein
MRNQAAPPRVMMSIAAAITVVVCFPYRGDCQDNSTQLEKKFREEAPSAWLEYRQFASQLQGVVTSLSTKDEVHVSSQRYTIKQNASCRLFGNQGSNEKGAKGQIQSVNPLYNFKLGRKTEDMPWAITKYDLNNQDNPQPEFADISAAIAVYCFAGK